MKRQMFVVPELSRALEPEALPALKAAAREGERSLAVSKEAAFAVS